MSNETKAPQPPADGGFTAADMMDARQEGRKEAQQPAAEAESKFYSQDFYEEARAGSKPWPGDSDNDR